MKFNQLSNIYSIYCTGHPVPFHFSTLIYDYVFPLFLHGWHEAHPFLFTQILRRLGWNAHGPPTSVFISLSPGYQFFISQSSCILYERPPTRFIRLCFAKVHSWCQLLEVGSQQRRKALNANVLLNNFLEKDGEVIQASAISISRPTLYAYGTLSTPLLSCCILLKVSTRLIRTHGWVRQWIFAVLKKPLSLSRSSIFPSSQQKKIYELLSWTKKLFASLDICSFNRSVYPQGEVWLTTDQTTDVVCPFWDVDMVDSRPDD